jgi:hypothetical protein
MPEFPISSHINEQCAVTVWGNRQEIGTDINWCWLPCGKSPGYYWTNVIIHQYNMIFRDFFNAIMWRHLYCGMEACYTHDCDVHDWHLSKQQGCVNCSIFSGMILSWKYPEIILCLPQLSLVSNATVILLSTSKYSFWQLQCRII